jgi:hypothetical protein
MARTTLNIDDPILQELKRLQQQEGKFLGQVASELLSEALAHRRSQRSPVPAFEWISRPMRAKVDLLDKQTLWGLLDQPPEQLES